MFSVTDKQGKNLWILDKIRYVPYEGMDQLGIITHFPEEGKVLFQPIGKDGKDIDSALPILCNGVDVESIDSLAEKAFALKTNTDFEALLRAAEERYARETANQKIKKAGTRGGTTKPKAPLADLLPTDTDF